MSQPIFTLTQGKDSLLVEFEIPGGSTTPQECVEAIASLSDLSGPHVLLINGRGPVWLYAMLVHEGHATQAVATFDPRLGYVVVQSHHPSYQVGSIVTL